MLVVGATPETMLAGVPPGRPRLPGVPASGDARGVRARRTERKHGPGTAVSSSSPAGRDAGGGPRLARPDHQRDGEGRRWHAGRSAGAPNAPQACCATCRRRSPRTAACCASRASRRACVQVAPETEGADARIAGRVRANSRPLAPERVWQELARGTHGGASVAHAGGVARMWCAASRCCRKWRVL